MDSRGKLMGKSRRVLVIKNITIRYPEDRYRKSLFPTYTQFANV